MSNNTKKVLFLFREERRKIPIEINIFLAYFEISWHIKKDFTALKPKFSFQTMRKNFKFIVNIEIETKERVKKRAKKIIPKNTVKGEKSMRNKNPKA